MKKAIIIGATSGIGYEVAKQLLSEGWKVGIAGRREAALEAFQATAPDRVEIEAIDVTDKEATERLQSLIEKMGGMDLFLLSSGIGNQNTDLLPEIELSTTQTNVEGFTRMVTAAFGYFKNQGSGHLAVISSIAGTKGLGVAPAYSATKRYQNTYIDALAQLARMQQLNISFTDIRPGFVATELLKKRNYPLLMQADEVGKKIVKALNRKKRVAIIDWRYAIIVFFWQMIPRCLWDRLKVNRTTLLLILALGIGATLPVLTSSTQLGEQHSVKSEVPYCVTSPTVPTQATFDGQVIDLRRYDRRERMDRELMAFTYMHSTTMQMLKRANRYFPTIEPILKANGIPDDFKYLMVIESNLNPTARSSAGAAGLWQIMPATGRELGLEVNDNVDERYHIEKSTKAACKYLKQAYAKYKDWMAVSAAYNAGQGRISSQLDKQLAAHAMDLWLVEETSRYMFRVLAAKEVFNNPQRFGFLLKKEHLYPPIPYTEKTVTTAIDSLSKYAAQQGVTYAQLRDANPWLREPSLKNKSGKKYVMRIPTQEGMNYDPRKTVAHDKRWVIN